MKSISQKCQFHASETWLELKIGERKGRKNDYGSRLEVAHSPFTFKVTVEIMYLHEVSS